jgi:hypothetical protein
MIGRISAFCFLWAFFIAAVGNIFCYFPKQKASIKNDFGYILTRFFHKLLWSRDTNLDETHLAKTNGFGQIGVLVVNVAVGR